MASGASQEAALEGLTYSRPNKTDHTLDENDLVRLCPLDNGRHQINPIHYLGVLDRLPLELLIDIFTQVDLLSLTSFRRINQRAMQVIDSIPPYQAVIKHSIIPLRAILSVELRSAITCQGLFQTLQTPNCENCGDFGGFIYLLTYSGVYFLCFAHKEKYLPLSSSEIKRRYGLNHSAMASLLTMTGLPGRYAHPARKVASRLDLINPKTACSHALKMYRSITAMERYVSEVDATKWDDYQRRASQRKSKGPKVRRPASIINRDEYSSNPKRFMGIVQAP
jgi:hypothetical protein